MDKALRRGHTSEEVDSIIRRFTGYSQEQVNSQLDAGVRYQVFLENAPQIDPEARNMKGVINGMRVENIEEPLMQLICWLEKLVDDMSRGKA